MKTTARARVLGVRQILDNVLNRSGEFKSVRAAFRQHIV